MTTQTTDREQILDEACRFVRAAITFRYSRGEGDAIEKFFRSVFGIEHLHRTELPTPKPDNDLLDIPAFLPNGGKNAEG